VLTSGVWGWWILGRNSEWLPGLRWTILALAVVAAGVFMSRRFPAAAISMGLVAALAGPAAYAIATIGQPHQGGGPTVGPADASRQSSLRRFDQSVDNPDLDAMLKAANTEWSAAINRSSSAASLELSTHTAVMAIGGFSGSDPAPTLSEFQDDVTQHKVAYYITTNNRGRGPGWGNRGHADIEKWVAATFPSTMVGDATVYNLSTPKSA
jgi:hypothetical protein